MFLLQGKSPGPIVQALRALWIWALLRAPLCKKPPREWSSYPVYGGADLGYYYIVTELGFPVGHQQNLILDTGSQMMIVPCRGCRHCNGAHDHGLYDPRKSKTCQGISPSKVYMLWSCSPSRRK